MDTMKRIRLLLCLLVGMILSSQLCFAESSCEHIWIPYDQQAHGVLAEEVELFEVNTLSHSYMQRLPKEVCALCGERTYSGGSAPETPHAYTVTDWERTHEGKAVCITLTCGVCRYVYTYEVALQTLLEENGDNCLHGGTCDTRKSGYLYENGMILFDTKGYFWPVGFEPGEKVLEAMLIYDTAEHTFLYTSRKYCPVCGKPRVSAVSKPQSEFDSDWNGMPIMTMDFFLTDGVPENLPYQLIDQLREEAAATP